MAERPEEAQAAGPRFAEGVGMFLWSLAEASFLFILPEVFLTWIAMQRRWRAVLAAMAWGLAGAAAGALLMYFWGAGTSLKVISAFLSVIPGVSRGLIQEALQLMQLNGAAGILSGMLQGAPGKVFAALAAHAGLGAGAMLAFFLLARAVLFAAFAALAWGLAALWRRLLPAISPVWAWGMAWAAFHALWFFIIPA